MAKTKDALKILDRVTGEDAIRHLELAAGVLDPEDMRDRVELLPP